eukprot:TRINITY_DN43538_c0_g1_i1.p1 TRINITY_DN43538_c0_g1~~TRINITY_DN43538_c0_g1_i1.p1  ORF type:complete len:613 (+),score=129.75 TRINITY_DN43538_c0_g1_i1:169-2007(+)
MRCSSVVLRPVPGRFQARIRPDPPTVRKHDIAGPRDEGAVGGFARELVAQWPPRRGTRLKDNVEAVLRRPGKILDHPTVTSVLTAFKRTMPAQGGTWHVAMHIFGATARPTQQMFGALMSVLAKAKQWEVSLRALDRIRENKLQRNNFHFSSAVQACNGTSEWRVSLKLLRKARAETLDVNAVFMSGCITACQRGAAGEAAVRIFSEFKAPDTVVYNATLAACARGALFDDSLRLFNQLKADPKCVADAFSYSSVIEACGQSSNAEKAIELMEEAVRSIRLTAPVFASAIGACQRSSDSFSALRAVQLMKSCGVPFDAVTGVVAASACERACDTTNALAVLDEVLKSGCPVSVELLNVGISACQKGALVSKAAELLHSMPAHKVSPTVVSYSAVISACAESPDPKAGFDYLRAMLRAGIEPDPVAYNAALAVCDELGDWGGAQQLFREMDAQGVERSGMTYGTMITCAGKADREEAVRLLLEDVITHGVSLTDAVLTRAVGRLAVVSEELLGLVRRWGRLRRGDMCELVAISTVGDGRVAAAGREMLEAGFEPSPRALRSILDAAVAVGDRELVSSFTSLMEKRGVYSKEYVKLRTLPLTPQKPRPEYRSEP